MSRSSTNSTATRRRQIPQLLPNAQPNNHGRRRSRHLQRHGYSHDPANSEHGDRDDHLRAHHQLLAILSPKMPAHR